MEDEFDDDDFDAEEWLENNITINGQPISFDGSNSQERSLTAELLDDTITGAVAGASSLFKKAKNAIASRSTGEVTNKNEEEEIMVEKDPSLEEIFTAMQTEIR